MKHLATWWEYEFDKSAPIKTEEDIKKKRHTTKAILFNKEGLIALIHYPKINDYPEVYSLPGGGVEEGEDLETTLRREILEEVGYEISEIEELGEIIEYHTKQEEGLKNICSAYKATVIGKEKERQLTEKELILKQGIIWLTPDEALKKAANNPSGLVRKRTSFLLKLATEN